jgi:hypothetical protein
VGDDFLLDEGVNKVGMGTSRILLKGKTNDPSHFFKINGFSMIGDEDVLFEMVYAKGDISM